MDCLSRLVVPCNLWSQLKFTILSSVLKANEMRAEKDKRDCKGLWGADMTIVQVSVLLQ